jgi:hypothetical protein
MKVLPVKRGVLVRRNVLFLPLARRRVLLLPLRKRRISFLMARGIVFLAARIVLLERRIILKHFFHVIMGKLARRCGLSWRRGEGITRRHTFNRLQTGALKRTNTLVARIVLEERRRILKHFFHVIMGMLARRCGLSWRRGKGITRRHTFNRLQTGALKRTNTLVERILIRLLITGKRTRA